MDFYVPLFLILPYLLFKNSGSSSSSVSSNNTKPTSDFPDVVKIENIEFAKGSSNPAWPVITDNKKKDWVSYKKTNGKYAGNPARSFGWKRTNDRYHVGIDIYGDPGDDVIAMENGMIVGIQGFLGPTKAMLVEGESGLVVLYGEITDQSWTKLGLKKGSFVEKGQKIATVGLNDAGGGMLHLETYKKGTKQNIQWKQSVKPDSRILNPTKYLLLAQKNLNS